MFKWEDEEKKTIVLDKVFILKDLAILSEMVKTHSRILQGYMEQAKCHRKEEKYYESRREGNTVFK